MSKWYYTRDGQQSGPISEVELKGLVASGRLPDSSLAWAEGMADWQPISSIAALAPSSAPPSASMADVTSGAAPQAAPAPPSPAPAPEPTDTPVNPYSTPASDMGQQTELGQGGMDDLQEIIPGSQPLDITGCIGRGFELTKRHFGTLLVIGIIMFAISAGASLIMGLIDSAAGWGQSSPETITGDPDMDEIIAGISDQGSLLNRLVCGLVDAFLGLGITRIALNIVSGQAYSIAMLFSQGGKTIRVFIAKFLYGLMVGFGFLLLIVPGIYFAIRYSQYENAIVDKDMGIFDAFSYSSKITQENKMSLLGFYILGFLIIVAGAIALLVGLLFAIPLYILSTIVVYRWLQYGSASVTDR